jgi:hypothetical protein
MANGPMNGPLSTGFLVRLENLTSVILARRRDTMVPLEKLDPVEFQRLAAFIQSEDTRATLTKQHCKKITLKDISSTRIAF